MVVIIIAESAEDGDYSRKIACIQDAQVGFSKELLYGLHGDVLFSGLVLCRLIVVFQLTETFNSVKVIEI